MATDEERRDEAREDARLERWHATHDTDPECGICQGKAEAAAEEAQDALEQSVIYVGDRAWCWATVIVVHVAWEDPVTFTVTYDVRMDDDLSVHMMGMKEEPGAPLGYVTWGNPPDGLVEDVARAQPKYCPVCHGLVKYSVTGSSGLWMHFDTGSAFAQNPGSNYRHDVNTHVPAEWLYRDKIYDSPTELSAAMIKDVTP